jgi:hypothetical protein
MGERPMDTAGPAKKSAHVSPPPADGAGVRLKILPVLFVAVVAAACTIPPPPDPPPPESPTTTAPSVTTVPPPTTTMTRPTTTTTSPPPPPVTDYDPADRVWIDYVTGYWFRGPEVAQQSPLYRGQPGDEPVPADYDGDGRIEIVVIRNGQWLLADGAVLTDLPAPPALSTVSMPEPVPADYDGDGRAEPAWYRDVDATWWIGNAAPVTFGQGPTLPSPPPGVGHTSEYVDQDYPVPADYDGDGRTDLSTYSPRTGEWRVRSSRDSTVSTVVLQIPDQRLPIPAPGDYDGVGHAQRAVVNYEGWQIEGHAGMEPFSPALASANNLVLPAVADHDGDGRVERAYVEFLWPDNDRVWRFDGTTEALFLHSTTSTGRLPASLDHRIIYSIARMTFIARNNVDYP